MKIRYCGNENALEVHTRKKITQEMISDIKTVDGVRRVDREWDIEHGERVDNPYSITVFKADCWTWEDIVPSIVKYIGEQLMETTKAKEHSPYESLLRPNFALFNPFFTSQ